MDDPASAADLLDTTVRVATWNLWWRFGPWEARLPLIIEELRHIDADVIALQEVWHDGTTSSAHLAAEALGYEVAYAGDIDMLGDGIRFGNAILSRWPITAAADVLLPDEGKPEGRLVVRADIDGPRGPLQVFCTHLNWRLDQSHVRQAQVRALAQLVADAGPRSVPPIICGDFNAEPHSVEIELLTGQRAVAVEGLVLVDAWHAAHPHEPGPTFRNANPYAEAQLEWDRRLDYVFVGWPKARGAGHVVRVDTFGTSPVGDLWPSDHDGVVADLRY